MKTILSLLLLFSIVSNAQRPMVGVIASSISQAPASGLVVGKQLVDITATGGSTTGAGNGGTWTTITSYGVDVPITNDGLLTGTTVNAPGSWSAGNSNSTVTVVPQSAAGYIFGNGSVNVVIKGLPSGYVYKISIFANRAATGANRTTDYTIGATTVSINAEDNNSLVFIDNVVPVSGEITLIVTKTAANTVAGYISSFIIEMKTL